MTETTNSNGVYRTEPEPFLATTHPMPPLLLDARARAADASSSALVVTVSLASLAEVHYAVFPAQMPEETPPTGGDGPRVDHGEAGGNGGPDGASEGGVGWDNKDLGSGGVSAGVGGRREATALNDTVGLVVSGVVPSAATAGLLRSAFAERDAKAAAPGAAPSAALGADGKSNTPASARSLEGRALEVSFRVEGLQAAQAYSVCLFTETPGSNGCVLPPKRAPNLEARDTFAIFIFVSFAACFISIPSIPRGRFASVV